MLEQRSKHEILAESPLFDNLLPAELSTLGDLFAARSLEAGQTVFEEGQVGDALYVIARGKMEVVRRAADGGEHVIASLSAPTFFGEMSLIDKEYRSATVRATGEVQLLQLTSENLHVFAKNYRNGFTWVVVNIARVLSGRLRDANRRLAELP